MKKARLAMALLVTAALAGCAPAPAATPTPAPEATPTPAAAEREVEIFTWWTAGGEAEGLAAMVEVFHAEYPQFSFLDASIAGGAGTALRAVLATRLAGGDPPSSWQGHAGQALIGTYVAAGMIQPLNDLFEEEGWLDVMPAQLIERISHEGNIYSVPVNIHRANVMWYIPARLAEWGVQPPTTLAEFLTVAETLQGQGVTPLAMGEQWTSLHLLETVLLGSLGAEAYSALWDGTGDWGSPAVASAIETFGQILEYTNPDASALSWDAAAQLVIDGAAAFTIMGDWAQGYFKAQGILPEGDALGWAPAPGTGGVFQFLSDSFVLPVNARNPEGALAWLRVAGSKAGQDAFNPIKGSIPARNDGDRALYDAYLLSAMDDWARDTIVGSLTHGNVANDAWKSAIDTALGLYLADRDAAAFQGALVEACLTAGPCD